MACHNVGVIVQGAPTSPRVLVRHAEVFAAYADGLMAEKGEDREAYLSHFAFGSGMQHHYKANRNSVAGYAGPCWCRWLVLDIDRPNLDDALADVRKLVRTIGERYPAMQGDVAVFFSGSKGFHVLVELAHNPPPAVGFHHTAREFAEMLAGRAAVTIDTSIYDVNRVVRLPSTKHPKTGLFKRRLDCDVLDRLDVVGILEHAKYPAGDGMPTLRDVPDNLAADWLDAERRAGEKADARAVIRHDFAAGNARAPRYFIELLRFGVAKGERHRTLFRCAAWLAEQGAPDQLVLALLTEPGCDSGLAPRDVERQIRCGIDHARRQRDAGASPRADAPGLPLGDAFEHPADRLGDVDAEDLDFPFGANVTGPYTAKGNRR
jgi:hypothetical protein